MKIIKFVDDRPWIVVLLIALITGVLMLYPNYTIPGVNDNKVNKTKSVSEEGSLDLSIPQQILQDMNLHQTISSQ